MGNYFQSDRGLNPYMDQKYMVILLGVTKFPTAGRLKSVLIGPGNDGNLTLQVWRPEAQLANHYFMIDAWNVSMEGANRQVGW